MGRRVPAQVGAEIRKPGVPGDIDGIPGGGRQCWEKVPMRSPGLRSSGILPGSLGALLLLAPSLPGFAQPAQGSVPGQVTGDPPPLTIPRVDRPIELDGRVRDPAWDEALTLEGMGHVPDFGAEPTEHTVFLVAHDGEHLYFACRNRDSDPGGIQAPSLRRNDASLVNDFCAVFLDTYHDGETSVGFATTPAGIRVDGEFANDAEGPPNFDWNTFWDVEVARSDEGWTAEIRVPFHSLGVQVEDGRVTMGLSAMRNIARKNEIATYPAISPRWGGLSFAKASQMRTVTLEGVEAARAVHFTPYALGGTGHTHALDGNGSAFLRAEERVGELGLDVQYGLGPSFTADVSLNTDFAQVEADDEQVNLDRFSLFFPEKRRFFQERAAIFAFPLRGRERLFHSRRVGLGPQGEPERVYGGARVVGRWGEWDLGALTMQTGESEVLPPENQGVVRVRRRVLNESSYTGGILTSRLGMDGSYNVVYGADALVRLTGEDYLTLNLAQSFDDGEREALGGSVGMLDRSLLRLRWERRGQDGFVYDADLSRAGPAFDPGLGFLFRRDYTRGEGNMRYGWRPTGGSRFLRYSLGVEGSIFRRNEDGTVETAAWGPAATLETRAGHQVEFSIDHRQEELQAPFRLSEQAMVPEGRHGFIEASLGYRPPAGRPFQPAVTLEGGEYFDGDRLSLAFDPVWAASPHLNLQGGYRLDRIRLPERDQRFTAHVARIRITGMLSTAVSASALMQYNSAQDRIVTNARFRFNPREGDDLFIVWNEGVNTNRTAHSPRPPLSSERTLLVKYSRTFSLER